MMKNFFKKINWLFIVASLWTMVFSPVAMGKEAEDRITKTDVQWAFEQMGLNKSMTFGEFYKKNKDIYPPRVQKMLEQMVARFGNEPMPTFEVATAMDSQGEKVPTIRVTGKNQLDTIQIYGDDKKFVKFDNTMMEKANVINFDDMLVKLYYGDERLRKQVTGIPTTSNQNTTAKFAGYPAIDQKTWKGMDQKQRAMYILNMRQLWSDSRKVLNALGKTPAKKTSSLEKIYQQIFANEAYAKVQNKVQKAAGSDAGSGSSSCVVAGYISTYVGGSCSAKNILSSYDQSTNAVVYEANQICSTSGSNQIACNPLVYGTPNGQPTCVTASRGAAEIQNATTAQGRCDTLSPLGDSVDFLNKDLKNSKRYDPSNLKISPDDLAKHYKDQQAANDQYVHDYLCGMLRPNVTPCPVDVGTKAVLSDDMIKQIKNLRDAFNTEITKARSSCMAATSQQQNDPNFWAACDQLQRRFLYVAEYLKKNPGCNDKGDLNPDTLQCACPAGAAAVNPGASCGGATPAATGSGTTTASGAATTKPGGDDSENHCTDNGKPLCTPDKCKLQADANGQAWSCVDDGDKKDGGKKSIWDKIWSGIKVAAPFVLGLAALGGLYLLLRAKKPKIASPGDSCGTVTSCQTGCVPPKAALNSGLCGCPACPGTQTITDASTCTCGAGTGTSPTLITCPDGTQVTNYVNCPTTPTNTYQCWNGTYVSNPINCPIKTNSSTGLGR